MQKGCKNQNSQAFVYALIGLKSGHALANFAIAGVLSEKQHYICFSQVPAGSDYPGFRPIMHIRCSFVLQPLLYLFAKNYFEWVG